MNQERCLLYQMKSVESNSEYIYHSYATLVAKPYFPNVRDYDKTYEGIMRPGEDVRGVRERLTTICRKTGAFREINVSDVIVLHRETGTICCFVDEGGYVILNGFFGPPASGNPLTIGTEHYAIPGKKGEWRVVDSITYENALFFLLEHEEHGRKIPCVILSSKGDLVSDKIINDFDETAAEQMRLFLHPELPRTKPAEHKRPPKEQYQKFFENGEYERSGSPEVNSEENYDHIDGTNNNQKKPPMWTDPKKRKSVRKRLHEKLNQVHGGKDKQRTREKA